MALVAGYEVSLFVAERYLVEHTVSLIGHRLQILHPLRQDAISADILYNAFDNLCLKTELGRLSTSLYSASICSLYNGVNRPSCRAFKRRKVGAWSFFVHRADTNTFVSITA